MKGMLAYYVNMLFFSVLFTLVYVVYGNLNFLALAIVLYIYTAKRLFEDIFKIKLI